MSTQGETIDKWTDSADTAPVGGLRFSVVGAGTHISRTGVMRGCERDKKHFRSVSTPNAAVVCTRSTEGTEGRDRVQDCRIDHCSRCNFGNETERLDRREASPSQ